VAKVERLVTTCRQLGGEQSNTVESIGHDLEALHMADMPVL